MSQKMRSSLGSVKKDAAGAWRVRVTVGRDPETGKRIQVERRVRGSERSAQKELGKMLSQVGRAPVSSDRMTVAEYFRERYIPWCASRLRPSSVQGYTRDVERYIVPGLGFFRLSGIDVIAVERWLSGIEHPGARLAAYKTLRQGLRQARRWKLVAEVVTDAIEPPKVPRYEAQVIDAQQAARLLAAFRGHRAEAAVLLALGCGMRRSEICGAEWDDFGPGCAELRISRAFHVVGGERMLLDPKTANSLRTVSLPHGFAARLSELAPAAGDGEVVEDYGGAVRTARPVLLDSDGRRMSPDSLSDLYDKRAREAGCRWVTLKNLRHSHATIMLESGVDVVAVSRRLGHSSVSITDRFYLRPTRAADKKAAGAFDSLGICGGPFEGN